MLEYNNDHIFTGYLKQILKSTNLPTCKIYSNSFRKTLNNTGKEDKRVVETLLEPIEIEKSTINHVFGNVNTYLRNNAFYNYIWDSKQNKKYWKKNNKVNFIPNKEIPGITKKLENYNTIYDEQTHEYLGDYLRFLRDYYDINLMSLYNCFSDRIYSNVFCNIKIMDSNKLTTNNTIVQTSDIQPEPYIKVDSRDPHYKLYALPVKLFEKYTIAIDSNQGVELFCGLYNSYLDNSYKSEDLIRRTYMKINKAIFSQPFLFDKLTEKFWNFEEDFGTGTKKDIEDKVSVYKTTRYDILNREKDLKLFIKLPIGCRSSIVVLEGDFRNFNDQKYSSTNKINTVWKREKNKTILNFENIKNFDNFEFKPISPLQLLAANTGTSHPFADRLIEYLLGSTITPIDPITDNVKRLQKVMNDNNYYFKIPGLWENHMQHILYDFIINNGPFAVDGNNKIINKREGTHPNMGYAGNRVIYDVLGYADRDTENCYASYEVKNNKLHIKNSVHAVDIYDGLFKE